MTDRENLCREFTELTGVHWHEWTEYQGNKCKCGLFRYRGTDNPTYDNPADVLRILVELPIYPDFIDWAEGDIDYDGRCYMPIDYFLEKDKLLIAAIEYLEEKQRT